MLSSVVSSKGAALPCVLLMVCVVASAHHGRAEYRTEKTVVLKNATVTKFLWANPHAMVLFDVKMEGGTVTHWAGEAGSPASIRLLGWNKNSLRPGDVVTIQLYASKFGSGVGRVDRIVLADGSTLENAPRSDRGDISRY
jgi:hypothetical protein